MSALEAELLQAADDTEALAREWGGRIAPTLDARAAGYRARAARVREGLTEEPNGMLSWACGPLNPASAGGTR